MTSTLRSPTYPSYEGRVIDISTESALKFINNADYPLFFSLLFTDLDTGVSSQGNVNSLATRGTEVSANVSGFVTNGHDYACTPTVYGRDPLAAAGSTSPGKYDVLLGTGRLQADSDTNTKVYIDKDITCIRTPTRDSTTLLGGCAIKITGDTYLITAYNSATGEATISADIINGSTSTLRTTAAGEPYKLISNYVVGEPFTFEARTTATCTLSAEVSDGLLHITGAYSQAQNVPVQSYKMSARYGIDGLFTDIEHERVFGTEISDDFPISPLSSGKMCTVTCEITTADNAVIVTTLDVSAMATVADITLTPTVGTNFSITGKPSGAIVHVWREERDSPEESSIATYNRVKYLGSATGSNYGDNIAGNQRTYRYIVAVVETAGTVHYSAFTTQFNIYDRKCLIWQLEQLGNHKYQLVANKNFTFSCDVDSGSVETVTSNAVYKSSAPKPKFIRGSDSYETGSFTAILGTVTAPEAEYYDIRKFVEMMTSDGIFLLKTDYGDVKIVAIADNPTRTYGANIEDLGITKVTFGWTEIDDIESAVIE